MLPSLSLSFIIFVYIYKHKPIAQRTTIVNGFLSNVLQFRIIERIFQSHEFRKKKTKTIKYETVRFHQWNNSRNRCSSQMDDLFFFSHHNFHLWKMNCSHSPTNNSQIYFPTVQIPQQIHTWISNELTYKQSACFSEFQNKLLKEEEKKEQKESKSQYSRCLWSRFKINWQNF